MRRKAIDIILDSDTYKANGIAEKALLLLPATTKEICKALDESPENIEDALKADSRFLPPFNRDNGPWTLSGAVTKITFDSSAFFDGDKFIPKRLADTVTDRFMFKTTQDNETIYFYDGPSGIWKPIGENVIKTVSARMLGEDSTTHRQKEVIGYIASTTGANREDFDPNPYRIALLNGVYDVETMEFFEHGPQYMLTVSVPIEYKPKDGCPKFKEFITQIVDETDIPVIQEIFGWCLVRNYDIQKMVMLLGEGANGKSTLLEALKIFLGTRNVSKISPHALSLSRFAISRLYGKLANLFNDVTDKSLTQTGMLKMLCGGDELDAEQKFKDYFSFQNYAKLIFSANKLPLACDDTDAWFRRWVFVNFPHKFEGGGVIPQARLLSDFKNELPGILNWALQGLSRLKETNGFTGSQSTDDLREEYVRRSNPVAAFCMHEIEEDVEGIIPKDELYRHYIEYCTDKKLTIVSNDVFFKRLYVHYGASIRQEKLTINTKRTPCIKGLKMFDRVKTTQLALK